MLRCVGSFLLRKSATLAIREAPRRRCVEPGQRAQDSGNPAAAFHAESAGTSLAASSITPDSVT